MVYGRRSGCNLAMIANAIKPVARWFKSEPDGSKILKIESPLVYAGRHHQPTTSTWLVIKDSLFIPGRQANQLPKNAEVVVTDKIWIRDKQEVLLGRPLKSELKCRRTPSLAAIRRDEMLRPPEKRLSKLRTQ